jgi:hypothetical protein
MKLRTKVESCLSSRAFRREVIVRIVSGFFVSKLEVASLKK